MPDEVVFDTRGAVAAIRLNRPAKRNALTTAMYARLATILETVGADTAVRVVTMTGTGGCFTAGTDVGELSAATELGPDSAPRRFLDALVAMPQVLVVGVSGPAVGVGSTLLLHADLVYATPDSFFAMPFVELGLVPEAAASLLLPLAVGHVRAAEMLLLGHRCSAAEALSWGLVNRLIDGDQHALDEHLARTAAALVAQRAEALRHTRRLLRAHRLEATRGRLAEDGALLARLVTADPGPSPHDIRS